MTPEELSAKTWREVTLGREYFGIRWDDEVVDAYAAAIRAAVEEERERCALFTEELAAAFDPKRHWHTTQALEGLASTLRLGPRLPASPQSTPTPEKTTGETAG